MQQVIFKKESLNQLSLIDLESRFSEVFSLLYHLEFFKFSHLFYNKGKLEMSWFDFKE